MVLMISPMEILVRLRLVQNWKFLEVISRFCAALSAISCLECMSRYVGTSRMYSMIHSIWYIWNGHHIPTHLDPRSGLFVAWKHLIDWYSMVMMHWAPLVAGLFLAKSPLPLKNGVIALWPNTRVIKCKYYVSQKQIGFNNKIHWYSILLTFIFKFKARL